MADQPKLLRKEILKRAIHAALGPYLKDHPSNELASAEISERLDRNGEREILVSIQPAYHVHFKVLDILANLFETVSVSVHLDHYCESCDGQKPLINIVIAGVMTWPAGLKG